ncbi:MAG: UDP-N-acetylmuramoyl-L-alanyl-D-glutamate--2,6-diaminopimelate ligase [Muribaculaceae bacterium]|nr:UDP-N-acetylmuramoyl-L-alanyl-D-glutamate--2,6-diaminopimelate ligase [Muribaculaceae bacterium]
MHKLNKLLSSIITEEIIADATSGDIVVTAMTADSRKVIPGSMFVAVRGPLNDGHLYIEDAINRGASVIVAEELPTSGRTGVTFVKVGNAAVALGYLASEWYGNPSRHLTLVGVTGTNGKTTVATLLYRMAQLSGQKAGLLSTVENRVDNDVEPALNTTPSPLETNRLLRLMVDAGCTFAAMEVSSHGMTQHRTVGLHFAGGVFTNLTRDHLDYHGSFKEYLNAKKSFFDTLPASAFALYNNDDRNGAVMVQNTRARKLSYGLTGNPDYRGRVIADSFEGMELQLDGIDVQTCFVGRFNAYNLTAVFATWVALGHEPYGTAVTLSRLTPVAGRFQPFRASDGTTVIVDYAHTPDALENVLKTINEIVGGKHEIYTVVGAGGDRDAGKRPMMGAVAARLSDRLVITSDNPRNENAADIAAQILEGVLTLPVARAKTVTVIDREKAIADTIISAPPGTVILIAGKGHETYQEFENRRRIHFDDREHAVSALKLRCVPVQPD